MKIALILALLAAAANFLMCHTKNKIVKKLEHSSENFSLGQSIGKDIEVLKQATADELGLTVEELNSMSVKEIERHARLKEFSSL